MFLRRPAKLAFLARHYNTSIVYLRELFKQKIVERQKVREVMPRRANLRIKLRELRGNKKM